MSESINDGLEQYDMVAFRKMIMFLPLSIIIIVGTLSSAVYGQKFQQAVIVVRMASGIHTLYDLNGKRICGGREIFIFSDRLRFYHAIPVALTNISEILNGMNSNYCQGSLFAGSTFTQVEPKLQYVFPRNRYNYIRLY